MEQMMMIVLGLALCACQGGDDADSDRVNDEPVVERTEDPLSVSVEAARRASDVLWYADPNSNFRAAFGFFDTHGFTSGSCADSSGEEPTVSTPTDARFGKIWRINKPLNRKRAEFARIDSLTFEEDGDYFIGWRWRATSEPRLTNGMSIFQWKSAAAGGGRPNLQNYPFSMGYDGQRVTLAAQGPGPSDAWWTAPGQTITRLRTTLWSQDVSPGSWATFVVHVRVSRDPDKGFIELWHNGSKQQFSNSGYREYQATLGSDRKKAYLRTNDGSAVNPKWGPYGGGSCDFDVTMDFASMRVAQTYESARP